jgi:Zn-dependent protease
MGSIKLLKVAGIQIRMHITFPLILVAAAFQFGFLNEVGFSFTGAAFGVVITLLLFVCVVIHELSHSLTAVRMGYPVHDIVLLPLGGVAQMEQIPDRPGQEFLMAIAGPLSNVAIAVILLGLAWGLQVDVWNSLRLIVSRPAVLGWSDTLPYLIVTNLSLAAFNLIPAFPMDGGRVLRALLATGMPHPRATALAVSIGQGLAWMVGLLGLVTGNLIWILIAIFVYSGAAQEGRMVRLQEALQGLRVRQAFSRHAQALAPTDPISRAVTLTLESFQADFPICEEGRLVGMVTRTDVLRGLHTHDPQTRLQEIMRDDMPTVGLDQGLFDAHQQMTEAGLDALPVMDAGRFQGLLTHGDVVEAYRLLSANPALRGEREGV